MITVERANEYSSKATLFGWFVGLAWFAYTSPEAASLPWWAWAVLIVVGMFAASVVIGLGFALVAATITKAVTGDSRSSPNAYAWGAVICPVIAFFCAWPAAKLLT